MNYEQINALEERLDIILLTMNVGTQGKPQHYEMLDYYRKRAVVRQQRRDETAEIKDEYFKLKTRIQEMESDHPELLR